MNGNWMKLKPVYWWGGDTVTVRKTLLQYNLQALPYLGSETHPVLQEVGTANVAQSKFFVTYIETTN